MLQQQPLVILPEEPGNKDKAVQEHHLLVSQEFNDGHPIPAETFTAIELLLCDQFSGFTRMNGLEGAWRAPDGTTYHDRLINYVVATDDEQLLLTCVQSIGRHLRQRAMYLRRQANTTMIIDVEESPYVDRG